MIDELFSKRGLTTDQYICLMTTIIMSSAFFDPKTDSVRGNRDLSDIYEQIKEHVKNKQIKE